MPASGTKVQLALPIFAKLYTMLPLDGLPNQRPVLLTGLSLPLHMCVAVLAPHPDDFDAIAVAIRYLAEQGHDIHVAVLTTGANGIEEGWNGTSGTESKAAIREAEQRESCAFFGLPPDRLTFLRLWEANNNPSTDEIDYKKLQSYVRSKSPDLVFLPHGNDSNHTHRRTYATFASIARSERRRIYACLSLDAKTESMRPDIYMYFGEQEAAWKAQLLRHHRSQQERNIRTRGYGFDERVLNLNRASAKNVEGHMPYAEVFELEIFG